MQRLPYTLAQAQEICKSLQHIVGHVFDPNLSSIGNVECVAISPFDHINKKRFLMFYMLVEDAAYALEKEYNGLLYDVVVIARGIEDNNEIMYYDADTWLHKNNLTLDIVHHSSVEDGDDSSLFN